MATYVNDLRLKEIATGDEAGTWGTSTNTNLELIGEALGYGTQDCFSSDADATTTVADGATDPARAMYFKVTSSATLSATRTLTIAPNTISRVMFIENATTGSQSINISQGSGANVTIATGKTAVVYLDGAGSGAAVVDAMALVDPGVTDTLAEVLTAGNTSGGTGLTMSSGDDLTLTGASYNAVWDSSDSALEFADNAKAIFGAGSDLEIYHDGSNSYVKENGTGNLLITSNGNSVQIQGKAGEDGLTVNADGSVQAYFNAALKLATTTSGIDVTGTVTTSGQLLPAAGAVSAPSYSFDGDTNTGISRPTGDAVNIVTGGTERLRIDSSGTLTTKGAAIFNEDSADADFRIESNDNANMFYVDAGNNRIGIGRVPAISNSKLEVSGADNVSLINVEASGNTGGLGIGSAGLQLFHGSSSKVLISSGGMVINEDSADFDFRVESNGNANMLFVDAGSDKVSIGGTAGDTTLSVQGTNNSAGDLYTAVGAGNVPGIVIQNAGTTDNNNAAVFFKNDAAVVASIGARFVDHSTEQTELRLSTTNSSGTTRERVTISGDGKVLIGDTASHTSDLLQIETPASGGGHGIQIRRNDANGDQAIGTITFGNNTDTDLAQIKAKTDGDGNSGDSGALLFSTQVTGGALTERVRIDSVGNVTITSVDAGAGVGPYLTLFRDSASPADNDQIGQIRFQGEDSAGGATDYTRIVNQIIDTTNGTEDGRMSLNTVVSGSMLGRLNLIPGEAVFNDESADIDFRIESNNKGHLFYVDAGNDRIGINDSSPSHLLTVKADHATNPAIKIEQTGNTDGWGFVANNNEGYLEFQRIGGGTEGTHLSITNVGSVGMGVLDGDVRSDGNSSRTYVGIIGSGTRGVLNIGSTAANGADGGAISFVNGANELGALYNDANSGSQTAGTMFFTSTGKIDVRASTEAVFNEHSIDADFRVESNGNANMLFVDAGNDAVGIGTNSITGLMELNKTSSGNTLQLLSLVNPVGAASTGAQLWMSGTNATTRGTTIEAVAQTTANNHHMIFSTSVGGETPTEKMRLFDTGKVRLGNSSDHAMIDVTASNAAIQLIDNNQSNPPTIRGNGPNFTIENGGHELFKINSTTEVVVNEASRDTDFRVESDNSTHAFFVDGANGGIGFGTSLNSDLHGSATQLLVGSAGSIYSERASSLGIPASAFGYNFYVDSDTGAFAARKTAAAAKVDTRAGTIALEIAASVSAGAAQTYFSKIGIAESSVVVNDPGTDVDFRVESDNKANALTVDAATDQVCIGRGTNGAASADLVTPFGTYGLLLESVGSTVSQNSYIDITVNSGGGGFQGMLTVSNTFKANAGARTHTMFFIAGRGTDAVATSIASDDGSSGAISFTVTFPSNGVIRITNTYAGDTAISAVFIGSQGF